MKNFEFFNPVHLHFGKNVTDELGSVTTEYGKRVLLIYGRNSAKKYGYYQRIKDNLAKADLEITEFSGIRPNPLASDVDKAVALAREKGIEVIVALGGGSVIDSAKIVSVCIQENLKAWDVMIRKSQPTKYIPLIVILTLSATGTEMNKTAVLQDADAGAKIGYKNPMIFPKHSFLDPSFTMTVSRDYTAYGITDLIAHAMEAFFGDSEVSVVDRFVADIIKDAMHWAPLVLDAPDNYEYRANIMLDATFALNGITLYGRTSGDWGVHAIGHALSLLYDIPHGATLSIVYPAWLKFMKKRIPERISKLGKLLFDTSSPDETIDKLIKFFVFIKSPVNLTDVNIDNSKKAEILNQLIKNRASGLVHFLKKEDLEQIVNYMM
ncbi:MAG TPA: iron-containing alcohol dehydrogenase [Bacteroidetes bacterium]|nr:iron-containing alcohol dehydrogenase [Bacteroidota bacterium]